MKNIHILPTDKAPIKGDLLLRHLWKGNPRLECISWWRYNETTTLGDTVVYSTLNGSFADTPSSFKTQYIYITSDEEIRIGDWTINLNSTYSHKELCRIDNQLELERYAKKIGNNCKKIILTTDQDLIKDGVQAIDDEFLEWFVKNPSCEYVKVIYKMRIFNVDELRERHRKGLPHLYSEKIAYKIIIPKEESKQETVQEVAERLYPIKIESCMEGKIDVNSYERNLFIEGTKWQSDRMYSYEDLKEAFKANYTPFSATNIGDFDEDWSKWFEIFKNK